MLSVVPPVGMEWVHLVCGGSSGTVAVMSSYDDIPGVAQGIWEGVYVL